MASSDVDVQIRLTGVDKFKSDSQRAFGNLEKGSKKGFGVLGKLAGLAGKAVLAAGTALVATGGFALKTAADFETMKVGLKTALGGSQKAAEKMFKSLTKFAAKTPLQTEEIVRSFVKLKNMGLDPSEKALTSYGNTAAAMGKSLNDMVEAVADAATGEFERLKEFGIKAQTQGDRVTFTFRGVKTEVGKNAKEIETYLKRIGDVNFAGGMEDQSKTLNGLVSTLKDNISLAFNDIAEKSGLLDIAKRGVTGLSDAIEEANPKIVAFIDDVKNKLKPTEKQTKDWEYLQGVLTTLGTELKRVWDENMKPALDELEGKFKEITGDESVTRWELLGAVIYGVVAPLIILASWAVKLISFFTELELKIVRPFRTFRDQLFGIMGSSAPFIEKMGLIGMAMIKALFGEGVLKQAQSMALQVVNKIISIVKGVSAISSIFAWSFKNAMNYAIGYVEGEVNKLIKAYNGIPLLPDIGYIKIPRFAQGGIVGGSSASGDRVMARVNSGEMILTKGQQGALFNLLKNMSTGNQINFNGGVNFTSNSSPMQQQNNFVNMLQMLQ